MSTGRNLMLVALMFSATFIALLPRELEAASAPQITGVWSCTVNRPGSPNRPLFFVFHSDGTFSYSSQTTVNGGSLNLPFTSRGGSNGQWQNPSTNTYTYQSIENMYINGNAGGFFYVDATLALDPKKQQLCSGTLQCPQALTKIRLTEFTFDQSGNITGEVDLLPANSLAVQVCSRLSNVFVGLP